MSETWVQRADGFPLYNFGNVPVHLNYEVKKLQVTFIFATVFGKY